MKAGMTVAVPLALLVAVGSAMAADGNDLIKWCRDVSSDNAAAKSSFGSGYCVGTISTVYAMGNYISTGVSLGLCAPPEMTSEQMARIVVRYLQENPGVLRLDAATLTFSAMRAAYPCK